MSAPPRVAYHTGEYPRATDTWIQREIEGLRRSGVDVHSFAARRTSDDHMVGPEQRDERRRTTYLVPMLVGPRAVIAHVAVARRSWRRYIAAIALMWRTRRPTLAGAVHQIVYFAEAGVLADELHHRQIPHLHNHFGDSSCTVTMLAAAMGGSTYSVALHGPASFHDAGAWHLAEKIRRAAFCVVVSRAGRQRVSDLVGTEHLDRVHVVRCGVEIGPLGRTSPATAPRLVFVGRLVAEKGLSVLLAAFEHVSLRRNTLVQLDIIGDGPDRAALEQETRRRGLADVVHFRGYQARQDVARMMAEADVLVLPSHDEGVPVTLIEALAVGTAIVATDVGDVRELVEPGVTGLLVEPGDPVSLADAIADVLDDHDLRTRLAAAGRSVVASEFDLDRQIEQLAALFARAAGTHTPTADDGMPARSDPVTTRRPTPTAGQPHRRPGSEPT